MLNNTQNSPGPLFDREHDMSPDAQQFASADKPDSSAPPTGSAAAESPQPPDMPAWMEDFMAFYHERFKQPAPESGLNDDAACSSEERGGMLDQQRKPLPWMQPFLASAAVHQSDDAALPSASGPALARGEDVPTGPPQARPSDQEGGNVTSEMAGASSGLLVPGSPHETKSALPRRKLHFFLLTTATLALVAAVDLTGHLPKIVTPQAFASRSAIARAEPALQLPQPPTSTPEAKKRTPPAPRPAPDSGLITLNSVQHSPTPDSTTVVVAFSGAPRYTVNRLSNPERIFIDFTDAHLLPSLNGRTYTSTEPCLRKYRMASRGAQIARVTFETGQLCDYTATLTPNGTGVMFALHPHTVAH